jgi:hypothetical protein
VHVANFEETQALTLSRQNWQLRAFGYYDDIGEIHFPANYVGNALAKIRLIAAEEPDSQTDEPKETDNKVVKDAIKKLRAPMGGQPALMKAMGINLFVAGECFLLGIALPDGSQAWEAVSINELEIRTGQKIPLRRVNPVSQPIPLPEDTLVVRVWRPHPRYTGLADSAMRNVLDECEKLLLLTRADKAAARSRLAGAGLLFIPNELMPVSQQPTSGSTNDVDPGANPIYKNLVESMITPIKDEQHPSGIVPVTIFGPAEYGDKIKFITFDRPQAARATQQREESIQRIATALDLPPEILTGKGDLNHWTAWQVHEETFQAHLQPFAELICEALTVGYLRPALRNAGVVDADKYIVWYDDSALVVRPDKGQTALQLHEANVISNEALRRETGFNEEDAMPEDQYKKRVGVILQDTQLALGGEPTPPPPAAGAPPAAGGKVGGDRPTTKDKMTAPKPKIKSTTPTGQTPSEKAATTTPVTASAARSHKPHIGLQLAQLDVELMTQLRTAASEVVVRELERAGARIRSKAQGTDTKNVIADVPNHLVASVLGPSIVASLDLTDQALLAGAFTAFTTRAAQLVAAAQRTRTRLMQKYLDAHYREDLGSEAPDLEGLYGERDRGNARAAIAGLLGGLVALATSRLYSPAPDAVFATEGEFDGLLVPASLIRETVSTAGGSILSAPTGLLEPEDFGGIGTGGTTYAMLSDNGVKTVGRVWVYGPAIRTPFNSHEDLDGLEFDSWEDDALAVREDDAWIGSEFYHPGDHTGCLCAVAPVLSTDVPETDAPQLVTAES